MKEPYGEGVASHSGLESWGRRREAAAQALTEVRAGRVLSREICQFWVPTASMRSEGTIGGAAIARRSPDPTRSETPCTSGNFRHGNREIPRLAGGDGPSTRKVNPQGARRR